MTFPRIRAPGMWTLGSVILPTEMEEFDQHQFEAVDGFGAGAYAPTNRLVLGGAGTDFTGGTGPDPLGPLTATAAPGTGASGIFAAGDGAGAGGTFTAGLAGGNGVQATTVDGIGGFLQATGIGAALVATAANPSVEAASIQSGNANLALLVGSVGGDAIHALAGGTGTGLTATGGSTSGTGVRGNGGGPNGTGVRGVAAAAGTGSGVRGDSSGSGPGVLGTATGSGPGVEGQSNGGAPAGFFQYTGANGDGLEALGAGTGAGARFSAGTATGVGVDVVLGFLRVQSLVASPGANPGSNTMAADQIKKAWGYCRTDGAGGVTPLTGVNYTVSVAGTGNASVVSVNFVQHMANTDYHVEVQNGYGPLNLANAKPGFTVLLSKTNAGFSFQVTSATVLGTNCDFGGTIVDFSFSVDGMQP